MPFALTGDLQTSNTVYLLSRKKGMATNDLLAKFTEQIRCFRPNAWKKSVDKAPKTPRKFSAI